MKLFKIKLREPEFHAIRFDGFDPMSFVTEFKDTGLAGKFYFNIRLEYNPTLEFFNRDDKNEIHKIGHEDYLIINEDNSFYICTTRDFRKTYKILD